MADITPARKLFDLLVSRDFDPEMLDVSGRPAPSPSDAELFSFDFRAHSGKDYGTVVVMLGDDNNFDVYFGDNVGKTMEGQDKTDWFNFLHQLKNFAVKNFMAFSPKNINRLRYSMQGQAAIKEGLFESWTGTKTQSWNGKQTEARLMIKHKKTLDETDARFRYVESLFVETAEGERYKLPFTKLSGGRAMVEHVRNGGKPYDARGSHIVEIVNELNVLSRFKRANQGKIFEGDTAQLVEQTNAYYETAQRTLKSLSTRKGYSTYFESWNPADITEEEVVIEGLKHLFVTQSIDTRIESALPLLAKIQQQGTAMKEANIFEAWAERLLEGTWQTPDTPEKQAQLLELMSTDLPVGADATNATEQLYDLLGDDHLFDQLEELADRDPNADSRQVILDRMQELSSDPNVRKVIEQLNIDANAAMNPPEATPADLGAEEPVQESDLEDCDSIGGDAADQLIKGTEVPQRKLAEDSLNVIRRAAGLIESRLIDEDGSQLDHILNRFKAEVRNFEQGGELDQDLYHALFDYYNDAGEMPYGVAKARDGDPMEWVAQNLESHLSGGGLVGGNPDEDYGIEREDVMGGDFAEERALHSVDGGMENPLIQDEGVIGTAGGALAGGGLGAMIGGALGGPAGAIAGQGVGAAIGGVGGQELTKGGSSIIEQGEEETDEGAAAQSIGDKIGTGVGTLAGAGLGSLAGPAGMVAGGVAGNLAGGAIGSKIGASIEEEETDEGWKGQFAGGTAGALAGGALGATIGPIGAAIGSAAGGTAGQMIGDKVGDAVSDEEETDEGKLGAVGGGVLGMAASRSAKGAIAGAKLGSAIQDRFAKKDDSSPLAGQYGHSGKMKEVGKDTSFLDRLKELSGLKR